MILNNFMTMKRIGNLKDQPLSRELILEIHRLVTLKLSTIQPRQADSDMTWRELLCTTTPITS